MKIVEPIREREQIEQMKAKLLAKSYRDYMIFIMGVNTAMRVSDILQLKVKDVRGRTHLEWYEKKTGKRKYFRMNDTLIRELDEYTRFALDDDYLFESKRQPGKPIDRVRYYRIINSVAREIGIQDRIGTHSMRKTFGYHFYQKTKDIETLMQLLNHSSPIVTRRYIGVNQDHIDRAMSEFSL